MGRTPEIPDGTPHNIGGWSLDPEPYNGLPWFGDDRRVSVLVRESLSGSAFAKVRDERVSGSTCYVVGEDTQEALSFEEAVERAVEWMGQHDPAEWKHPRVEPAAFDVPEGYEFRIYSLGERTTSIRYRIEDEPEALNHVTLHIEGYDSTDNWTVEIARHPITTGHGEEIWEPEKGTPLVKVLTRARRLAAAIRADPSTVTEPDVREINAESLLEDAPRPSRPQTGQTELMHYGGES